MANTRSAKKNVRKNEKRRAVNLARRSAVKTAVKKVTVALEAGTAPAAVNLLLQDAAAELSRAKSKGVMHANTAARKIGRLAKRANAAAKAA
jgi:small subunit ribosomal protein S20